MKNILDGSILLSEKKIKSLSIDELETYSSSFKNKLGYLKNLLETNRIIDTDYAKYKTLSSHYGIIQHRIKTLNNK